MLFQTYKSVLTLGGDLQLLFLWCWTFLRDKHNPVTHVHTLSLLMHAYNLHLPTHTLKHQQQPEPEERRQLTVRAHLSQTCRKENKGTGGPSYSTMLDYNYSATLKTHLKYFEYNNTYISQHTPHTNWINVAVMAFFFPVWWTNEIYNIFILTWYLIRLPKGCFF